MLEYLKKQIKKDFPDLVEVVINGLQQKSPVTIKVNPCKEPIEWGFHFLNRVPWSDYGYYLKERFSFVEDPLWHSGAYYVQEPSSMFIDFIIKQILHNNANIKWKVLDLCAAPGGKTLSLAALLPRDALIVANEVDMFRVNILFQNIIIAGYPNIYLTHNSVESFPKEPFFNLILIDAPCSGEGMYRKNQEALSLNFNEEYVKNCSLKQYSILEQIKDTVLPGGYLIYSTCTFNTQENEQVIYKFLSINSEFEPIFFPIPEIWNIYINDYQSIKFYRFFPGILEGEGLSLTVLRKKGELNFDSFFLPLKKDKHKTLKYIENHLKQSENFSFFSKNNYYYAVLKNHFTEWQWLSSELKMIKNGVFLGILKGNNFIPEHEWVLNIEANRDLYPCIELDKTQALQYLQKKTFELTIDNLGINILQYQNLPVGIIKNLGKRWNNLLPNVFKIRKNISS